MKKTGFNQKSNLSYNVVVTLLIAGIFFLSWRLLSNYKISKNDDYFIDETENLEEIYDSTGYPDEGDFISEIWIRIKEMNFMDPTTILSAHMPYLSSPHTRDDTFEEPWEYKDDPIVPTIALDEDTSRQSQRPPAGETERYGESDGDEREISEEIQIQIKNIKDELPPVILGDEGPQILVYHTHSREAFRQDPDSPYKDIAVFRSNDFSQTVVGVGEELTRQLQALGIPVIHDKTDHEVHPWKSGLYPWSLKTIQKRMNEYDTLKIFLDIHRNYNKNLKDPDKEVTIINGERVAKFFVLIGTAEGVSGGFSEKPKWRENYQFALKITNKANEKYPGLARDVMVRTGRYNQHVSNTAIIIEVGNHLTTYAEAKRSAKYIAEVLSEIIQK
ncbi:MAG: hypothetical protein GX352_00670 [Clostridiales bacterium]|nr:hypothetical protein [Clostridiales bacterium]